MKGKGHTNTGNRGVFAVLAAVLVALSLAGASDVKAAPRPAGGELEHLLPGDTAAVIHVTGLHDFWDELAQSAIRNKIEHADIPEIAQQFAKAQRDIADFELQTGISIKNTLSAILGKDCLIALLPDGDGVFVARSTDSNELRLAVDTILAIERNDGKITDEKTEAYHGVEIHSMVVSDPAKPGQPPKPRNHAVIGDLLIVSESRDVVAKVIDTRQRRVASLAKSPDYLEAKKLMVPGALATVYVNTGRIAETGILEKLGNDQLKNPFVQAWHVRIKHHLTMTRHLVINFITSKTAWEVRSDFTFDESKTPATLKALMPPKGASLDVAGLLPANTVASISNRVNKTALWRYLVQVLQEANPAIAAQATSSAQQIGTMFGAMDFEKELLPQIGDQLSVFVTPGGPNDPPALSLAVELADGRMIPQTIRTWAGSAATVNRMEAQKKNQPQAFSIKRTDYHNVNLTTLEIHKPPFAGKISPTLCVVGRFMVISSSADAARAVVDAFAKARPKVRTASQGETTFTRGCLDVRRLSAMIGKHKVFLIRQAVKDGKPQETAIKDLRNLDYLLSFFDSVQFSAAYVPGRVIRTCTIKLAAE